MKKIILKIMLGSVIAEVVLVCLLILLGKFDEIAVKVMGSVATIFIYSIPCLLYSRISDDERYKIIATLGASLAGITAIILVLVTLGLLGTSDFLLKIILILNDLVGCLAIISWVLSYESINDTLALFKKIVICLSIILCFYSIIIILMEDFPEGILARLYFMLIVLNIGSLICFQILTRVYKRELERYSYANEYSQSQNQSIGQLENQSVSQISINQQTTSQSQLNNQIDNQFNNNMQ